jgi:hypothetical protein
MDTVEENKPHNRLRKAAREGKASACISPLLDGAENRLEALQLNVSGPNPDVEVCKVLIAGNEETLRPHMTDILAEALCNTQTTDNKLLYNVSLFLERRGGVYAKARDAWLHSADIKYKNYNPTVAQMFTDRWTLSKVVANTVVVASTPLAILSIPGGLLGGAIDLLTDCSLAADVVRGVLQSPLLPYHLAIHLYNRTQE